MEEICGIIIPLEKYPIFTKIDPPGVSAFYLEIFLKDNIDPLVDPFNLKTIHIFMAISLREAAREK